MRVPATTKKQAIEPERFAHRRAGQPVAAMVGDPVLLVFDSTAPAAALRLQAGGLVIGRGEGCDVPLLDPAVSRRHCLLTVGEDGIWLKDLDSTNGSYVNGCRVEHRRLAPGDVVGIGASTLRLGVDAATAALEADLLGRSEFAARLDALVRASDRAGCALAMIAVDDHRLLDAKYGAPALAQAAHQVGNAIRALLRSGDFAAQEPHGRFVVLLRSASARDAVEWAQALCDLVAGVPVTTERGLLAISLSVGVALQRPVRALPLLFESAGVALRRAHREGRGVVCA